MLVARDAAMRLMQGEALINLDDARKVGDSALLALNRLNTEVMSDEACSARLRMEMRRIAFLPDGLSEFFHVSGNRIVCSVTADLSAAPIDLGPPDISLPFKPASALWINRDLELNGIAVESGVIMVVGAYGVLVPSIEDRKPMASWVRLERVISRPDGQWWHRGGTTGVFQPTDRPGLNLSPSFFTLRHLECVSGRSSCIATEGDLLGAMADWSRPLGALLIALALVSAWVVERAGKLLEDYWSLEARLRRGLSPDRVVCHYQPLLNLHTGRVVGCEVLARWRDGDGKLVYPDAFIPLVEKLGRTETFTALVIKRAFEDLSEAVPAGEPFQVNVNIFPQDFDADILIRLFAAFRAQGDRFTIAVELVESATVNVEALSKAVVDLKAAGISTYIDDFGTGYANMQTLAGVPIDGVKLDKSFAMAPNDSMMARMLRHALEMIAVLGRVTVVEGIETDERLAMLKASGLADFGQGYGIARPMPPEALATFLRRPRMVRVA